jgi:hypothetical protein
VVEWYGHRRETRRRDRLERARGDCPAAAGVAAMATAGRSVQVERQRLTLAQESNLDGLRPAETSADPGAQFVGAVTEQPREGIAQFHENGLAVGETTPPQKGSPAVGPAQPVQLRPGVVLEVAATGAEQTPGVEHGRGVHLEAPQGGVSARGGEVAAPAGHEAGFPPEQPERIRDRAFGDAQGSDAYLDDLVNHPESLSEGLVFDRRPEFELSPGGDELGPGLGHHASVERMGNVERERFELHLAIASSCRMCR